MKKENEKELRKPYNTEKYGGETVFMDGMMRHLSGEKDAVSNAILDQEARGQRDLVQSDVLPREINMYGDGEPAKAIEYLTSLGFQFKGDVPDDKLFQYVIFPDGWKKIATDHSMHSNLVDPQGRIRGGIFYKAAFYDRAAHMHLNRRFQIGFNHYDRESYKDGMPVVAFVKDALEKVVFESRPFEVIKNERGHWNTYDVRDEAEKEVKEWLDAHYPEWNDYRKYWN